MARSRSQDRKASRLSIDEGSGVGAGRLAGVIMMGEAHLASRGNCIEEEEASRLPGAQGVLIYHDVSDSEESRLM